VLCFYFQASPTHELQFQDIPHSEDSSQSTTPAKEQTHTFTKFPESAGSDDDDDKTDLLKEDKRTPSFWTFEYYQQYFDVDTHQVLHRILGSMIPNPKTNYLQQHIRPNPDLYGPFWICTTLVFTTAIAGNLANYFQSIGHEYTWHYDFHKVTFAATAIYSYWWIIPTIIWGLLMWRGSQAGYTYLEMICVYGYSLAIYVPISILWTIQVSWLQWLLVLLGMGLSGAVLVITFWPAIRDDNKQFAILTVVLILLFHGLLAIGFVLYFFHVPADISDIIPAANGSDTTVASILASKAPNKTL